MTSTTISLRQTLLQLTTEVKPTAKTTAEKDKSRHTYWYDEKLEAGALLILTTRIDRKITYGGEVAAPVVIREYRPHGNPNAVTLAEGDARFSLIDGLGEPVESLEAILIAHPAPAEAILERLLEDKTVTREQVVTAAADWLSE